MIKKRIAVIIAITGLMVILSGCGNSVETVTSNKNDSSNSISVKESKQSEVEKQTSTEVPIESEEPIASEVVIESEKPVDAPINNTIIASTNTDSPVVSNESTENKNDSYSSSTKSRPVSKDGWR